MKVEIQDSAFGNWTSRRFQKATDQLITSLEKKGEGGETLEHPQGPEPAVCTSLFALGMKQGESNHDTATSQLTSKQPRGFQRAQLPSLLSANSCGARFIFSLVWIRIFKETFPSHKLTIGAVR